MFSACGMLLPSACLEGVLGSLTIEDASMGEYLILGETDSINIVQRE
jgi:hypothetical protein